jgi:hypothetical protein
LCRAAAVSRASYYRFLKPGKEKAEEMELRDAIQKLAVQMPAYGALIIARRTITGPCRIWKGCRPFDPHRGRSNAKREGDYRDYRSNQNSFHEVFRP